MPYALAGFGALLGAAALPGKAEHAQRVQQPRMPPVAGVRRLHGDDGMPNCDNVWPTSIG